MYSEELETLIEAAIEDGSIDEAAQSVLIKRAEREGVDVDELCVYVNSKIKKRRKQIESEKAKTTATPPVSPLVQDMSSKSNTDKCPYCGSKDLKKRIDGTFVCEDCGKIVNFGLKHQTTTIASSFLSSTINSVNNVANNGAKSRLIAAFLALFFGVIGSHYFYIGNTKKGIITIVITLTLIGLIYTYISSIISAIKYFTMSNDSFNAMCQQYNK